MRSWGLVIPALLAACGPGSDEESSSLRTCADVYDKLMTVCGLDYVAEQQRVECEIYGPDPSTLRCIEGITACASEAFDACDLNSRTYVCSAQDPSCPPSLLCDEQRSECAACLNDGQCPPERACSSGLCLLR